MVIQEPTQPLTWALLLVAFATAVAMACAVAFAVADACADASAAPYPDPAYRSTPLEGVVQADVCMALIVGLISNAKMQA